MLIKTAAAQIKKPRPICTAQAVFRKAASPPRLLCTMLWRSPRSENRARPYMIMVAIAITPNISGTRRRVITRLPPKRIAWPRAKPASVQPPARSTRARSASSGSGSDEEALVCIAGIGRERCLARIGLREAGDRPVDHRDQADAAGGAKDHQDAEQRAQQRLPERVRLAPALAGAAHGNEQPGQHHEEEAAEQREPDEAARQRDAEKGVDHVDDALPCP